MSSSLDGTGSAPGALPDQPDQATAPSRPRRSVARLRTPVLEARGGPETQRRVRDGAGLLSAAAMRRLDEDLEWYRALPAEDRSWVGPGRPGRASPRSSPGSPSPPARRTASGDIFAAAPPELTRSISLQHTLQLVRVVVDVVETHSDRLAAPGDEREVREAVLRYSREVAFSAAEVYARAAEVRGAWDARLEALVVDALVRGDVDDALRSRIAALGWSGRGSTLVMVGTTTSALDDVRAAELRRATRRAADDALVGIQGDRLVVFLGGEGDLRAAATTLLPRFGPGPVVIGPVVGDLTDSARSARAALVGPARCARVGAGTAAGAGRRAAARARARSATSPHVARSSHRRTPRWPRARAPCWRPCRPTWAPAARSRRPRAPCTCTRTPCGTACAGCPT